MSFWETMRGVELADVLIHTLPKIASKKQYTEEVAGSELTGYIEREIANGSRYVTHMETTKFKGLDKIFLVVMEGEVS